MLNVVRKAEQAVVNDPKEDKEYLPITGIAGVSGFRNSAGGPLTMAHSLG